MKFVELRVSDSEIFREIVWLMKFVELRQERTELIMKHFQYNTEEQKYKTICQKS